MQVFTGPQWLYDMFEGFENSKGTAIIKPVLDNKDRPVLGVFVLQDPTWAGIGQVTAPPGEVDEGITKPILDWIKFMEYERKPVSDI